MLRKPSLNIPIIHLQMVKDKEIEYQDRLCKFMLLFGSGYF